MKAILLDDNEMAKWDEFIMSTPGGAFSNLSGWRKVYDTYGFKSFPIAAINDTGIIRGVLPLFLMRDIFGKKFLVSNPFLSYGGLCAVDEKAKIALIQKAKETAIINHVEYLEIRQLADIVTDLPEKKDFVTMVLKLEKDENLIWNKALTSVARNRIRKAFKANLVVDFGRQYLHDFYRVFSVNMRDLGTPVFPISFFESIFEEFRDVVDLIVVKHQDVVIGAMLFIHFRNVCLDPWVSSLKNYNQFCPGDLLYWEAIKKALMQDAEYFDFGRSTINSGTYRFKKKWGAYPVQLNYQYFLNKACNIPVVNANNNKYQLAINIWKRLPLIIANTIGPRLIKYLPEL
ncbi:FemAB family PEP-CTERM system-associated protein [candidate division WS5 bacterium]|uniref:FemAB family PEP-CTERM system-associated protein n=1 Tax=candidate division WS5 bacterium TaxID=2093353 RepID=A0A419D9Z2_9BACT|nr:MAG: FemAB family PEP-CTERM system-associated protein [candidate division WS5 bacterium]